MCAIQCKLCRQYANIIYELLLLFYHYASKAKQITPIQIIKKRLFLKVNFFVYYDDKHQQLELKKCIFALFFFGAIRELLKCDEDILKCFKTKPLCPNSILYLMPFSSSYNQFVNN
jgi:hypothetical protein